MRSDSIRLAFVAGAALAIAGTAHAAPAVDFSKLGPKQQAHMAKVLAAKQGGITAQYNYDIRPAVLKGIKVGGQVKANLKYPQAVVSLRLADNLSGVHAVSVFAMSPSGNQYAQTSWTASFENTREDLQLGIDMSSATENGIWRVYSVTVSDANNNTTQYDEAALAAMGKTTFTVSGAAGDFEPPVALAGGTNLTPTVSLSTPPRGMLPGADPRVGVTLKLSDAGAAGISSASMEFCLEGTYWECFSMSGSISVRGQSDVTLTLGGHPYSYYVTPGNYIPRSLSVSDFAGNNRSYYVDWGDDLNSLFDNPVIVITE
jgi:hypothetical protein